MITLRLDLLQQATEGAELRDAGPALQRIPDGDAELLQLRNQGEKLLLSGAGCAVMQRTAARVLRLAAPQSDLGGHRLLELAAELAEH